MVSQAGAKVGGRWVHSRQAAEPGGGKESPLSAKPRRTRHWSRQGKPKTLELGESP